MDQEVPRELGIIRSAKPAAVCVRVEQLARDATWAVGGEAIRLMVPAGGETHHRVEWECLVF
jgi:hypothetical protein